MPPKKPKPGSVLKYDPTRTTTLRRKAGQVLAAKLAAIGKDAAAFIARPHTFATDEQRVVAFRNYVKGRVAAGLLDMPNGVPSGDPYFAAYIADGYLKGAGRAYSQAKGYKPAYTKAQAISQAGVQRGFIKAVISRPVNQERLRALVARTFTDIQGVGETMATRMTRELADGLVRGEGVKDLTARVQAVTGKAKNDAMRIARTEIIRAHAEGQLDGFEAMGVDKLGVMVEWATGPNPCPKCAALAGTVSSIQDARGIIPFHPNCLLGDTRVLAAGAVAVMKASYSGSVVELHASGGRSLSVTGHHVVLTQRGWVFAKEVTKSDYLVDCSVDGLGAVSPDDDKGVPAIRDVFHSVVEMGDELGITKTLPMPEDLHGDGKFVQGEIEIVRTEGVLWDETKALENAPVVKSLFDGGDVAVGEALGLHTDGRLSSLLKRAASAADSLVCRRGVTPMFFARSLGHEQPVSFSLPPEGVTAGDENAADGTSAEAQSLGDGVDAHVCGKELADFVAGKLVKVERLVLRHVENLPVYDVATNTTAYAANGFLTSNCRCAWLPIGEDWNLGITKKNKGKGGGKAKKAKTTKSGKFTGFKVVTI